MRKIKVMGMFLASVILGGTLSITALGSELKDGQIVDSMRMETQNSSSDFEISKGILKKYTGTAESVVIPDEVLEIGADAFMDCTTIKSIIIPDHVYNIESNAFASCINLKEIVLPSGIQEIKDYTFYNCKSLVSVKIPSRVNRIGNEAFRNCINITEIELSDSLEEICASAFRQCVKLKVVTIPSKVTTLGSNAFSYCSSLTSVVIPDSVNSMQSTTFANSTNVTIWTNQNPYVQRMANDYSIPAGIIGQDDYVITYELGGGTNHSANPKTYIGATNITLSAPTRTGYTFAGWYKENSFTTALTMIDKGTTGNMTVYAKWQAIPYKITYQLNGGQNNAANPTAYTIESAVSLKNPTRSGYTFGGWYKESSLKTAIQTIAKGSTGNLTVYAKWTKVAEIPTYKVTFNKNNGTKLSKTSITVTKGKTYGTLPTIVRKGYTFKGWYTKKSGGTKIVKQSKVAITKNQTLYAQWRKVTKPAKVTSFTLKNSKTKQAAVKIKKVSAAKGYEILYSTKKDFKASKAVRVTSSNGTLKGLKKGSTYYVKVRAYKLDSMKNKIFGSYSSVIRITIKK